MTRWCLLPNLICYLLAGLFYLALPFGSSFHVAEKRRLLFSRLAFVLTGFGALLHLIYLAYLSLQFEFLPLSFVSFGVVVLFLFLAWLRSWQGLGSIFLPLAFILWIFSLGQVPSLYLFENASWLIFLHIFSSGLAFVLMVGNFGLGVGFLIHEKNLKTRPGEAVSFLLPPLLLNEKYANILLRIGFVLLTFVLLTGSMLVFKESRPNAVTVLHIPLALTSWIFYAFVLNRHWTGGRKILLLSFIGFVSLTFAYLWT